MTGGVFQATRSSSTPTSPQPTIPQPTTPRPKKVKTYMGQSNKHYSLLILFCIVTIIVAWDISSASDEFVSNVCTWVIGISLLAVPLFIAMWLYSFGFHLVYKVKYGFWAPWVPRRQRQKRTVTQWALIMLGSLIGYRVARKLLK
jgi:hypothetical protein